MIPLKGGEENDFDDFLTLINHHRNDHNYSPHGTIGDRGRPSSRPPSSTNDLDRWLNPKLTLDGAPSRPNIVLASSPSKDEEIDPLMICRPEEEDPTFKNDLAHVLVWFEQDLSSQQRLSTVFTLAKNLSKWQVDMLIKCLTTREDEIPKRTTNSSPISHSLSSLRLDNEEFLDNTTGFSIYNNNTASPRKTLNNPNNDGTSSTKSNTTTGSLSWRTLVSPEPIRPPGLAETTWSPFHSNVNPPQLSPNNSYHYYPQQHSQSSSSSPSPVPSLVTIPPTTVEENINMRLFYADLPAWLRYHRLHKYEEHFQSLKPGQCLDLTDEALDRIGVKALGARRKFLRLFELIRSKSS